MTELGFLGAGNMGSAIMRGICSSDMQISVSAYDKDTACLLYTSPSPRDA